MRLRRRRWFAHSDQAARHGRRRRGRLPTRARRGRNRRGQAADLRAGGRAVNRAGQGSTEADRPPGKDAQGARRRAGTARRTGPGIELHPGGRHGDEARPVGANCSTGADTSTARTQGSNGTTSSPRCATRTQSVSRNRTYGLFRHEQFSAVRYLSVVCPLGRCSAVRSSIPPSRREGDRADTCT